MRLVDADKLRKCAIPCEIHNGVLTDMCVPLYQIDNAQSVEPFAEVIIHLRDRIKDINHKITISQSDEAKCILDGKRKAFQYVLDLLEVKKNEIR